MTFEQELIFVFRILIAGFCGAVIGYERSKRKKEAGIRTHIVVALGAALVMVVSKYGFFDVLSMHEGVSLDPSRIAANVVSGISFLGAGVIFFRDVTIKGLTTAAGIWATAAIGLAIGAGMYLVGIVTAGMIILMQYIMHKYLSRMDAPVYETISVTYEGIPDGIERLKSLLQERGIKIDSTSFAKNNDGTFTVTLEVYHRKNASYTDLWDILSENPHIKKFSI